MSVFSFIKFDVKLILVCKSSGKLQIHKKNTLLREPLCIFVRIHKHAFADPRFSLSLSFGLCFTYICFSVFMGTHTHTNTRTIDAILLARTYIAKLAKCLLLLS